jgi:hypothetical protein
MSNIDEKLAILETKSQFNKETLIEQNKSLETIKESAAKIEIGMAIIAQKLDNLSTHENRITILEKDKIAAKASWKVIMFVGSCISCFLGWCACYFSRSSK